MKALNWILEALIEWVVGKVVRIALDWITTLGLSTFGLDLTIFKAYFPYITDTTVLIRSIAIALLFLIVVWQIFRAFLGPLTDAESPIVLIGRGGIATFFIMYAYQVVEFIRVSAVKPLEVILDRKVLDHKLAAADSSFSFAGMFDTVKNAIVQEGGEALKGLVENNIVVELIVAILIIVIAWNYFKLLLEIIERYVVFAILYYLSPLAFAMSASKTTLNVFKAYLRMFMSEVFLIAMNGWFLYGFNSSVEVFITNKGVVTEQTMFSATYAVSGKIAWCLVALAYLKTCQRFDMYLAQLGLNTAQTGGFLAAEIMMAAKSATRAAGKVKGFGDKVSNAMTGGRGGMLGNYFGMKNGQFESKPSTKTINDTAKGMDKAGMFNAFNGGDGKNMSTTEKDYLASMAAKGSDAAKSRIPNAVLGSTNADEAMRALHGGLLPKDNIVAGSSRFSTNTTMGNAKGKLGSAQTTLDYGQFGRVNFTSRMADGNMKSGEFMFKGADGQARYGKLEAADPNNPNSAIALNTAKAQMLNQSKLAGGEGATGIGGNSLISDGGNVFNSGNKTDTTGQKILDTLNGIKGSAEKMSGPNVNASADFAIPAFKGQSVVGEFSKDGFKGFGINPDGSATPLELSKGAPKDGKQGSAVFDKNGNAYTAKVGGDLSHATASQVASAKKFSDGLNVSKGDAANNLRQNINSAIGGNIPAGFNSNVAAGSLAAVAGLNSTGATGSFSNNKGNIEAFDKNGNKVSTSVSRGSDGKWNASSTVTDKDGNTVMNNAASGTNAAAVMQASMNPSGFTTGTAANSENGIPSGVDRVISDNAFNQKLKDLAESTADVPNIGNISDFGFTGTVANSDGLSSTMLLNDKDGNKYSTPFSMKPNFDADGNLTGYTATVGTGNEATSIVGSSDAEVMGKAMQVANGEGIAAGQLSNASINSDGVLEKGFDDNSVKNLLENGVGLDKGLITGATLSDDGIKVSAVDGNGMAMSVTGNSFGSVGTAVKEMGTGNIDGAVATGATVSGDAVSNIAAAKSGLDASQFSGVQASSSQVSGVLTNSNGNMTKITAPDMASFASGAKMVAENNNSGTLSNVTVSKDGITGTYNNGSGETKISASNTNSFGNAVSALNSGNISEIAKAVSGGAVVSGAVASNHLASASGISASKISNASISSTGVSGVINGRNGATTITAPDVSSFGSVAKALNSGSANAVSDIMSTGGTTSGAAVVAMLNHNGVSTSNIANASIGSGGISASITDSKGNVSSVSATDTGTFRNAVNAFSNGNGNIADVVNTGATVGGAAAVSHIASSGKVDAASINNASVSSSGVSASYTASDGSVSGISASSPEAFGKAANAIENNSISAIGNAVNNDGAVISGAAASNYLTQESGVSSSSISDAVVSSDGVSATYTAKNGSVSEISAGNASGFASAAQAVETGYTSYIENAANSGAVIGGDAAALYAAKMSGVNENNISNAVVSGEGASATYTAENGAVSEISASNVNTFASAINAVESNNVSEIGSAAESGAVISGAGAESYISQTSGVIASNISDAVVSSDGVSATYTDGNGSVSEISAGDSSTFAAAASAVESNSVEGINNAVNSGAVISGDGAATYLTNGNDIDVSSVSDAVVSSDGVSATYTAGNGSVSEISAGDSSMFAAAVNAVESDSVDAINNVVDSGAAISGAAAAMYIEKESGVNADSLSGAVINSDGMSASYSSSFGLANISAGDSATFAQATTAVDSQSVGDMQRAVNNGASFSGEAADNFFSSSSNSSASFSNSSMAKDSYHSDISNDSGNYSVSSSDANNIRAAGSFDGDYGKVMNGDYGSASFSGSGSTKAFADAFGGSEDNIAHASFSKGSASMESTPDSNGNIQRIVTVMDPATGGYSTRIETVDKSGYVIHTSDIHSSAESANKIVAEATAAASVPQQLNSDGKPDVGYYARADVKMVNSNTGVIQTSDGRVENATFDKRGKNIVAINGQKLDAPISYRGNKTELSQNDSGTKTASSVVGKATSKNNGRSSGYGKKSGGFGKRPKR